jgi:hypothetical protein
MSGHTFESQDELNDFYHKQARKHELIRELKNLNQYHANEVHATIVNYFEHHYYYLNPPTIKAILILRELSTLPGGDQTVKQDFLHGGIKHRYNV